MKPWYRFYGWKQNPFFVKSDFRVVGLDEEKHNLISFVESGVVCFVTGDHGIGKTSLLKWLERKIKGHVSVYIDCESISEIFDLKEYLKTHKRLWRDFFRKFPKNVIVLLDEAQASENELKNTLKHYWESDYVKSIVISQTSDLNNFSKAFRKRIGKRVINLQKMPRKDVHEMIELRTGKKNPFTVDAVDYIAKSSGYVPRKILENFEWVCIKLSKRGGKKKNIDRHDVAVVLKKRKI